MIKKPIATRFPSSMPSGPLALAMALGAALPASAAPIYYDGTAAGTWTTLTDWSTDPNNTTPDPAAIPGAADDVIFNVSSVNGAETIALGGNQSANSLTFNNTGTTTITGTGTSPTPALTIGAGGINVAATAGAASITLTGTSSGTYAPLFLSAGQTWSNLSSTALTINNNVNTATGAGLTISNGTFDVTPTSNFNNLRGGLVLQNSAKLQVRGDLFITGTLDGTSGTTIENSGAASKWMFVNNGTGSTGNFGGTIQGNPGNPANVRLGFIKQGLGTQNISGNITGERIAAENGLLNITGGTSRVIALAGTATATGNNLVVAGSVANQNGRINVNGGSLISDRPQSTAITSGSTANAQGFVRLNSGSITATSNEIRVGSSGGGSYGAYTQNGGVTNSARWMGIAASGTTAATGDRGVVNLNGGTMNVGTLSDFLTIAIGNVHSVGVFNANGGTLNATAAANGGIYVGERGNGTLNVRGGTVNAATAGLVLGAPNAQTGWNGTTNLISGTINTNRVAKGLGTGVASFNFHGGTLAATSASPTFMQGLDSAYVYNGGGTIANTGNNITITQSLLAPTGNGVSATGLTVTGSGFLDTPLVNITGDGVGAKAVANIDASGNLTGITIVNPGVGYTTAAVSLLTTANGNLTGGIGATASITGTPSLVANSTGGLNFTGTGITRLTGNNTYGNSDIGPGTNLEIDGTNTGGVTTTDGDGILSGIGTINGTVVLTASTLSPGASGGSSVGTLSFGGAVSLDSSSTIALTINDEAPGGFDRIANTGTLALGSATLSGTFTDTTFAQATSAGDLAAATRYGIVTGSVTGMFGNATVMSAGDVTLLGLSGTQYEVSLSGQRFLVEAGSINLVPLAPVLVPEPSGTAVALSGLALLTLRRRRR